MKAIMASEFGFNTPFKEQLDFFRQKINLPSERWDDITKQAHDKAFIVAGAVNADLLQDLRNAIDKAIAEGKGLEWFRKEFKSIVAKRGWTNYTGSGSKEGIAWRTKVIYQTNMSTSYAAGRYKQLTDPAYLKLRPNWKYIHSDSVQHPRPIHKSWDGTVLPHNHPFWQTHFAPNGWGCQCRIVPARGGESIKPPPQGWDKVDQKTGAPIGIDKGFDYAPGASVYNQLLDVTRAKLEKFQPEIAAALTTRLAQSQAFKNWYDTPEGSWPMVKISQEDAALIGSKETVAQFSVESAVKQKLNHADLTAEDYAYAQYAVDNPTHKIQDGDNSLIYVWDANATDKNGFVVVIKSTKTGKGLFFNSYRKLSRDEIKKDVEIQRILNKRGR